RTSPGLINLKSPKPTARATASPNNSLVNRKTRETSGKRAANKECRGLTNLKSRKPAIKASPRLIDLKSPKPTPGETANPNNRLVNHKTKEGKAAKVDRNPTRMMASKMPDAKTGTRSGTAVQHRTPQVETERRVRSERNAKTVRA